MNPDVEDLFEQFEERAGGSPRAAELLRVAYHGSYTAWRRNDRVTPPYVVQSMRAHLALSDAEFRKLMAEIGEG